MEPRSRTTGSGAGRPPDPVTVLVPERRWRGLVPHAERVVRRAAGVAAGNGVVVLESDRAVRLLNARHRGRNKPTNVLSFEPPPGVPGGDIVIAYGVVRREAIEQGRTASDHLAHLVVHAMLHLDGFEHGSAGEARRMEMQEARLLSRIGVPNPWKPRG